MDNSTPQSELLMKYFDGEMSSQEKEDFENRLAADKQLAQEFEDLKTTRAAVKMYGLKQDITGIHHQMMEQLKPGVPVRQLTPTRRLLRYGISIAASILLLMIGVVGYNFLRLSPERLYQEKYQPYQLVSLRGDGQHPSEIESDYQQKNYIKVIADVQKLQAPSVEDLFLSGVAYLQTGNVTRAINSFESVIRRDRESNSTTLKDEAEYYLALSYVRNQNYGQALDLIQAIRNDSRHLYHDQFSRSFVRRIKMLKWR